MSEERPVHTQESAEGDEENVEAPGVEKAGEGREQTGEPGDEEKSAHPQEPAEGGEEEVEGPGTERSGD